MPILNRVNKILKKFVTKSNSGKVTGYKPTASQKILLRCKYFARSFLKLFATTISQTNSVSLFLILKYNKTAQIRQVSTPKFQKPSKAHASLYLATYEEKYI